MEEEPQPHAYRDRNADEQQQDALAHFLFSLLRRINVRIWSLFDIGVSSAGGRIAGIAWAPH